MDLGENHPSFSPSRSPQLLSDARPEDLQTAQDFIRKSQASDDIIAVFRSSEKKCRSIANKTVAPYLIIPCLWPTAIICSPCLCKCHSGIFATLRGTLLVLGQKNLYKIVDDRGDGMAIGMYNVPFPTGWNSGYCALKDVISTSVNSRGGGESLIVELPYGCPIADIAGAGRSILRMLVEDPDQASMLIRRAKEAAGATQQQTMQIPQMVMGKAVVPPPARKAGGGGAGDLDKDILTRIQILNNMRDQGLITETDYEMKKQEILTAM